MSGKIFRLGLWGEQGSGSLLFRTRGSIHPCRAKFGEASLVSLAT